MVIIQLIIQEWKKSYRSQGFYKNLAVSFMLFFFTAYIAVALLFLGFSLNELLERLDSKQNPMELFNGAMLYIMLGGLVVRFALQQLNTFNLPPYQILPVKRSLLVNFLLLKPLASPINYLLLLVVIPFSLKSVVGYYDTAVAIRFVISFIMLVWFDSLLAAFLKRKFGAAFFSFALIIFCFGGFIALEYFKLFSLFTFSKSFFGFIVLRPWGLLVSLSCVVGAFFLNKWYFSQNYYPENFNRKIKGDKVIAAELTFLNRFGIVGELISLELKLILRHKRTKGMLYMSVFFLFYGLIFYTNKTYEESNAMLFFAAVFMTGFPMFTYGQWVFSWDSAHFDSLMTRNIPVSTYIYANYLLMVVLNVICFILTSAYFFYGTKIMYLHFAALLLNLGVNSYFLLWGAMFKTKRINLSKSSSMNYQGMTYKNYLIIFPIIFFPMLFVWAVSFITSLAVALWIVSIIGIAGILLRKPILNGLVQFFNGRKYKLAQGFRESE